MLAPIYEEEPAVIAPTKKGGRIAPFSFVAQKVEPANHFNLAI